MSTRLEFGEYLGVIEGEAAALGAAVAPVLGRKVPSCPEWSGGDLLDHVCEVLHFWAHQLEAADPTDRHLPPRSEGRDAGEDPVERLDEEVELVVGLLSRLGPEEPCWNWSGAELESGWVARRMALELAVHRYDAELTGGKPNPIATELAVDGIDERIDVHLRSDVPGAPEASLGGSICLGCTDADAAWVIEVASGRVRCRGGAGPASAVVRGPASEIFLFTWNRVGLPSLELTGDEAVARAWSTLPA